MTRVLALLLCAAFVLAEPAFAQDCDASVSGKAGDVVVEHRAQGVVATWVVERGVVHGEETSQFARPALELDFPVKADGSLGDLIMAYVAITRISDPENGRTPSLREVDVKVTLDGARPLSWLASDYQDGQRLLARALQKDWPRSLEVQLVAVGGGRVHASAVFDLTMLDKAGELAKQAMAKCS